MLKNNVWWTFCYQVESEFRSAWSLQFVDQNVLAKARIYLILSVVFLARYSVVQNSTLVLYYMYYFVKFLKIHYEKRLEGPSVPVCNCLWKNTVVQNNDIV